MVGLTERAYNFNAGPAAIPFEVLQQAQEEFLNYQGIGMSIMEISHRSKEYEEVNAETQNLLGQLLGLPAGYKVLFLQGGASTQFGMIPMNFLSKDATAAYVQTGSWSDKAIKEAQLLGQTSIAASSAEDAFKRMPDLSNLTYDPNWAYLHMTSNETIAGTQFQEFPDTGSLPLFCDMSSDILCRPLDVSKFALIYAGAQKNLGPSGVTVVIIREELLQSAPQHIPSMLRYDTHAKGNSLYNTPPVYSVYMMNLVLKWIQNNGGLVSMEQQNRTKTQLIYETIDASGGFYQGLVDPDSRSIMNITFAIQDAALEKQFIQESEQHGFVGLKGHRDVGHLRASTYNAVPYASCKALAEFMADFQKRNG